MLWGIFEYISSLLFFFLHVTSSGSFPKALSKAEETRCLEQMAAGDRAARQKQRGERRGDRPHRPGQF